jgi:DNA repair protein RecO (recombination protein O)
MPRFIDQAICIRELDWSETSQLIVLLTSEHGKVRGLAKGSKRQSPSSLGRFSGGIGLLTAGQVVATTRPSRELAAVTEWDLQRDYLGLRRRLHAQRVAMYAADLCHAVLAELDPHPGAFGLLQNLLDAIGGRPAADDARADHAEADRQLLRFQWGLLVDAGYRPELHRDIRGGELGEATAYSFDPVAGGLTTQAGPTDWRVRAATVRHLRAVAAAADPPGDPAASAIDPQADAATVARANRLLCTYWRSLLDQALPTMSVVLDDRA